MCGTRDTDICSNGRSAPLLPHRPVPGASRPTPSQRGGGSARWCFLGVSKWLFPLPNQTTGLQAPANRLHLFVSLTFRWGAPIRGSSEWTKPASSSDAPASAQTHYSRQQSSGQRFPQDPVTLPLLHTRTSLYQTSFERDSIVWLGSSESRAETDTCRSPQLPLTSADTDSALPVFCDTAGAAMRAQGYRPLFCASPHLVFCFWCN